MLCRALLTALAFSCTLSSENILAHGHTPRLVQIKDLICVLILSGVQKDELDVNTVRKLQRHNVNIDDMNNETLHKECLSNFREDKTTPQINIKDDENQDKYITTGDSQTAINRSEIDVNDLKRTIKKTELEMIMKYYINQQSTQYSFTTKPTIQRQQNVNIHKKYNDERLLSEPKKNAEVSAEAEHSENDKTRNLENILKFWQRFKQEKRVKTDNRNLERDAPKNNSNNSKDYDQKPNRQSVQTNIKSDLSITESNNRIQNNQRKDINKMIEDYFSNQRTNNVNTTTLSDVKLNIDFNNRQMNAPPQTANANQYHFGGEDGYSNWSNIRNNVNVYKSNIETQSTEFTDNKKPQFDTKLKSEHDNEEYKEIQRNNDAILRLTEQFSGQSKILPRYNQRGPNTNQFYENNYPKSYSMAKQRVIIDETKALGNNNNYSIITAQVTKMPINVLKEIAESVKAIVLKDLRNEMTTVSPSISTTVKTTKFTEDKSRKPEENPNQVIQKLMELIEQMKSLNKSQAGTTEKKQQLSHNHAIVNEYPVNVNFPAIPYYDNPYPFRQPEQFPVISNPYTNFNYRTQNNGLNKKIHKQNNRKANLSHKAAIIQTNSNEIPPLAIPLSKPSILINQNIMITTIEPIRNSNIKLNYGLMSNRYNFKFLDETKKQKTSLNVPKTNIAQHVRDLDSPTRYDLRDAINKYRDAELRIRSRGEVDNNYDRMPRKDDYHQRTHTTNDFQGFHERLERVDDGSRYSSWENKRYNERDKDRCSMKVASRQQLPLNTIKHRSSYDDTHFRNFLKTQQKVNAMLERVLATKAISDIPNDGVRSVELP